MVLREKIARMKQLLHKAAESLDRQDLSLREHLSGKHKCLLSFYHTGR